jgi:hypothetical protein
LRASCAGPVQGMRDLNEIKKNSCIAVPRKLILRRTSGEKLRARRCTKYGLAMDLGDVVRSV